MAGENETGQEKTEQPTEKRLQQARDKGQAPNSKEVATAAIFGTVVLTLYALGENMASTAAQWMRLALDLSPAWTGSPSMLPTRAAQLLGVLTFAAAPLLIFSLLASVIAPTLLGGLKFSAKALIPDFNRLHPGKGFTRMYGREASVELLRSLLRVAVIGGLMAPLLKLALPSLLSLINLPLEPAVAQGFDSTLSILRALGLGILLLALLDAPYQIWSHKRNLMMSRQELRDELKESDGNPEVRARIRQLQRMWSQGRMMEAVPKADVILVNPTHYAVALAYDSARMRAPRVVAKGVDEIALAIRHLASSHEVPIVSSPSLARALYRQVEIGREIPVALYSVVAEILGYVFQLRTAGRFGPKPILPNIQLPE